MTMENQTLLSAAQVLAQIEAEIAQISSQQPLLMSRLERIRRMQSWAGTASFGGRFVAVKKMLHRLIRPVLLRQIEANQALIDLIEDLYLEIDAVKSLQAKRYAELEHRLRATRDGEAPDTSCGVPVQAASVEPTPAKEVPMPSGLRVLGTARAEMLKPERVLLYALVYGRRPKCCLEIGTFRGGSSVIICAAMDDAGCGRLVCVDPAPRLDDATWQAIQHRAILFDQPSPQVLTKAAQAVADKFDFVLIDGDHSYQGVLNDVEGVLPLLADEAYLLFHDSHYVEVRQAIETALKRHSKQLMDCGLLSVEHKPPGELSPIDGQPITWGGLRLLRYQRHPQQL